MEIKLNEPWITGKVRCQNGYAYIDNAFWNTEKQQSDHKREYIGKYDGTTFTPNKNYHRLKSEYETSLAKSKTGPVPTEICLRQFYGATYLLDRICDKTGVAADLGKCFGSLASQILSIAYYLIIEEGLPLYRFHRWGTTHRHPHGKDIPSQRSSELFGLITEDAKMAYFKHQAKRHSCKEYLAFDTTSISSYSTLIKQAKYGKNKEGDSLPQINLALLYGEESMLPVYYRKLAGNITDVKTIENLVKDVDFLKLDKLKLVMDRGFYSEKNINDLMKHHHKFLIGVKMSIKLVSRILDRERDDFVTRFNYNSELKLYIKSFTEEWDYTEKKSRSGETVNGKRRIYLHVYYNDQKATDDKNRFNTTMCSQRSAIDLAVNNDVSIASCFICRFDVVCLFINTEICFRYPYRRLIKVERRVSCDTHMSWMQITVAVKDIQIVISRLGILIDVHYHRRIFRRGHHNQGGIAARGIIARGTTVVVYRATAGIYGVIPSGRRSEERYTPLQAYCMPQE